MTYDNKSYRVVAPATQSLHMRDTNPSIQTKLLGKAVDAWVRSAIFKDFSF